MTKVEKTSGKTATLFQEGIDYAKPSPDRPFKWKLEDGNIIYLNLEQRQFLARDYYNESKREEREKRCIIPSSRKGMTKRCRGVCSECEFYRSGKDTYGTVSLDTLYDNYDWEPISEDESNLDKMIYDEQRKAMYEAIEKLEDERIFRNKQAIYDYKEIKKLQEEVILIEESKEIIEKIKEDLSKSYEDELKSNLNKRDISVSTTHTKNSELDFIKLFNSKENYYKIKTVECRNDKELNDISKKYNVSINTLIKGYDRQNGKVVFKLEE